MKNARAQQNTMRSLYALVVEDDMLIMLDIEEILLSMGIPKVSCATSIEAAVKILEAETPDLALVDFNLGKSTSLGLALKLQGLDVPFAFVTALVTPKAMSPDFAKVPLIAKPFTESDIRNAVNELLGKSRG